MQQIVDGSIQPDIWSPAGSIWPALLNSMGQQKHGSNIVSTSANDNPSLVTSPVVIAMWKPEAEALGWPSKPIGCADTVALRANQPGRAITVDPKLSALEFE